MKATPNKHNAFLNYSTNFLQTYSNHMYFSTGYEFTSSYWKITHIQFRIEDVTTYWLIDFNLQIPNKTALWFNQIYLSTSRGFKHHALKA